MGEEDSTVPMAKERLGAVAIGIHDAMEACADALLTVCGVALHVTGDKVTPELMRDLAVEILDFVLLRGEEDGAKPR